MALSFVLLPFTPGPGVSFRLGSAWSNKGLHSLLAAPWKKLERWWHRHLMASLSIVHFHLLMLLFGQGSPSWPCLACSIVKCRYGCQLLDTSEVASTLDISDQPQLRRRLEELSKQQALWEKAARHGGGHVSAYDSEDHPSAFEIRFVSFWSFFGFARGFARVVGI